MELPYEDVSSRNLREFGLQYAEALEPRELVVFVPYSEGSQTVFRSMARIPRIEGANYGTTPSPRAAAPLTCEPVNTPKPHGVRTNSMVPSGYGHPRENISHYMSTCINMKSHFLDIKGDLVASVSTTHLISHSDCLSTLAIGRPRHTAPGLARSLARHPNGLQFTIRKLKVFGYVPRCFKSIFMNLRYRLGLPADPKPKRPFL
uniref:Uncharacterized protein n=1 Tax=Ananas comosus var. bracteatus TaxID=296719 RepID=A0A6V7NP11_ANACO|nr:unnamed protein product [Ananas comosus var. bracteatus]